MNPISILIYKTTVYMSFFKFFSKTSTVTQYGLANIQCSCYFNSSFQCLISHEDFMKYFNYQGNEKLFRYTQKLIRMLKKTSPSIRMIKNVLAEVKNSKKHNYSGHMQEDAQEFIQDYLNQLSASIFAMKKVSLIKEFEYSLKHISKCTTCENAKEHIITGSIMFISNCKNIINGLQNELNDEKLTIHCEQCKNNKLFVQSKIWENLPNILLIGYRVEYNFIKTMKKIHYSIEINDHLIINDIKYVLFGFIKHLGNLQNSGHYIAYTKRENAWYLFDDNKVIEIKSDNLISLLKMNEPYLLFYKIKKE
ncbi:putative ubiquitin carboxyl-terminal hydrolase 8 [Astathelohania contejeani]|uniref:Ubiquitin carboxyl-terminal hydrolase 8 n=1 Tax=Astathelohania contejeani TaxID=164912 RepID=A0ABQ7HV56_9MICR|nr:putative ubiquitin carboxyl-terminal hydrolase 8 [Thelohania contejeani]